MLPQSREKSQILSTGTHERQHIQNSTSLINHYIIQQGLIDSCLTDHIQYTMLHHSCAFQSSFSGHFMRPRKKKKIGDRYAVQAVNNNGLYYFILLLTEIPFQGIVLLSANITCLCWCKINIFCTATKATWDWDAHNEKWKIKIK